MANPLKQLHDSVARRDGKAVRRTLKDLGAVPAENRWVQTAIVLAAKLAEPRIVTALLDAGADIESTWHSDTPLGVAAHRGWFGTVKLLVETGADIDRKNGREKQTPLTAACYGADRSRLYLPVNVRFRKVAKLLIDLGADVNAVDWDNRTPISYACHAGDFRLFRMLREAGADPISRHGRQLSPLYYACYGAGPDALRIVKVLMELGANPMAPSKPFGTPVSVAIRSRCDPVIRFFAKKGVDLDVMLEYARLEYAEAVPMLESIRRKGGKK